MAFKMKGSPMQRNFGIGGALKKVGIFDDAGERISRQRAKEISDSQGDEGGVTYTGKDALQQNAKQDKYFQEEGLLEEGQSITSDKDKKIFKEQDTLDDRQAQEKVQKEANEKELDALRKARRKADSKKRPE